MTTLKVPGKKAYSFTNECKFFYIKYENKCFRKGDSKNSGEAFDFFGPNNATSKQSIGEMKEETLPTKTSNNF